MRSRTWLTAVVLVTLVLVSVSSGQPPVATPTMRVHFIDVGQGAATLLEFPCAAVLVDTGGEKNGEFDSTEELLEYLEKFFIGRDDLRKTLASMILTHPHIDHTRGVKAVLERYRVRNAVTNGQVTGSGHIGQKALHAAAAESEETAEPMGFTRVRVTDIRSGQGLATAAIDPVDCPETGVDPRIRAVWGASTQKPSTWTADTARP